MLFVSVSIISFFVRFEKPLLMQVCRLLRGFTHPGTYFEASTEELALYRCVSKAITYFSVSSQKDFQCMHTKSNNLFNDILMCVYAIYDVVYSVERFSTEINTLLEITLRSRLVEKLCVAMYSCLFDEVDDNGQEMEVSEYG